MFLQKFHIEIPVLVHCVTYSASRNEMYISHVLHPVLKPGSQCISTYVVCTVADCTAGGAGAACARCEIVVGIHDLKKSLNFCFPPPTNTYIELEQLALVLTYL